MQFLAARFWLWAVCNMLGHLVSFGIVLIIGVAINSDAINQEPLTSSQAGDALFCALLIGIGLVDGTVVGLLQLVVLRHYIRRAFLGPWVLSTALGGAGAWVIGLLMGVGVFFIVGPYVALIMSGGVAGAIVGIAQSRVLWRDRPELGWSNSSSWIIANSLAGAVAVLIGGGFIGNWSGLTVSIINDGLAGWLVSVATAAMLYGAITGFYLSKFDAHSAQQIP